MLKFGTFGKKNILFIIDTKTGKGFGAIHRTYKPGSKRVYAYKVHLFGYYPAIFRLFHSMAPLSNARHAFAKAKRFCIVKYNQKQAAKAAPTQQPAEATTEPVETNKVVVSGSLERCLSSLRNLVDWNSDKSIFHPDYLNLPIGWIIYLTKEDTCFVVDVDDAFDFMRKYKTLGFVTIIDNKIKFEKYKDCQPLI